MHKPAMKENVCTYAMEVSPVKPAYTGQSARPIEVFDAGDKGRGLRAMKHSSAIFHPEHVGER